LQIWRFRAPRNYYSDSETLHTDVRKRLIITFVGLLALLLIAAGGVYAYDSSRSKVIADGITVGGIDVGGLDGRQARAKLRHEVLDPLNQPVVARQKGRRFTLKPERARVAVDIDGSVTAALDRSREGSVFARTVRNITGGEVEEDVSLDISYSKPAVERLVSRVKKKLERPAVDAHVNLEQGDVTPQASKDGLQVRARTLGKQVAQALVNPQAERNLRIQTRVVKPKVTSDQLAAKYPAILIVNRSAFRLEFYKNLKQAKTYKIAVGQVGLETPAGLYNVQNKAVNPAWSVPNSDWAGDLAGKVIPGGTAENPLKARWMGIYDGAGIHGTDAVGSLGTAASHGCIRMAIPDVKELYRQVPVGAPVYIA
jgi:lipoprotein-anchoring transpeptidase ErfK/SrfK